MKCVKCSKNKIKKEIKFTSQSSKHRTVLFVSIRDTIFSFVGRRLYFQFPASTIVRASSSKTSSCLEKKNTAENYSNSRSKLRSKKKNHIHFHCVPLWICFFLSKEFSGRKKKKFFKKNKKFFFIAKSKKKPKFGSVQWPRLEKKEEKKSSRFWAEFLCFYASRCFLLSLHDHNCNPISSIIITHRREIISLQEAKLIIMLREKRTVKRNSKFHDVESVPVEFLCARDSIVLSHKNAVIRCRYR